MSIAPQKQNPTPAPMSDTPKGMTERQVWHEDSALTMLDVDADRLPRLMSLNKAQHLHNEASGWVKQTDKHDIRQLAARCLADSLYAPHHDTIARDSTGNIMDTSVVSVAPHDIDETVRRAETFSALPHREELLAADYLPMDLVTRKRLPGVPWANRQVSTHGQVPHTRRHFSAKGLAQIHWNPAAEFPMPVKSLDFINWMACDYDGLADFICAMVGRSLCGDRSQPGLPILIGPTGNGKSVLLKLMRKMLGGLAISTSVHKMAKQFWYGTYAAGCVLVTIDDMTQRPVFSGAPQGRYDQGCEVIKQITGGDGDDMMGERKYQRDAITVSPPLTLWAASNYVPAWIKSSADADAWRRRFMLIPCHAQIEGEVNTKLVDELYVSECDSFAMWCYWKYLDWIDAGRKLPVCVVEMVDDLVEASRSAEAKWADECLAPSPDGRVANHDAYQSYDKWAEATDNQRYAEPGTQRRWHLNKLRAEAVRVSGGVSTSKKSTRKGVSVHWWSGLTLKQ